MTPPKAGPQLPSPTRSAARRDPQPAAERVAEALRGRIIEGTLGPGSALRETLVAADLDASRNTVREAFRLLAHDGLVDHTPNRGVAVRKLSRADVVDIYRVRRFIERQGLLAAAADPAGMVSAVQDAERAATRQDWAEVATGDLRFHQAVVAALASPRFDQLGRRVLAELRLAFAVMPDPAAFHGPYLRRNRHLVDLVLCGRIDDAVGELDRYLDDAEAGLLAGLS